MLGLALRLSGPLTVAEWNDSTAAYWSCKLRLYLPLPPGTARHDRACVPDMGDTTSLQTCTSLPCRTTCTRNRYRVR